MIGYVNNNEIVYEKVKLLINVTCNRKCVIVLKKECDPLLNN